MGEAWWDATARHTNLARNQRDRLGITIVLGSLPDAWAEEIPFEPPEFEVEDEEGFVEEGGRPRAVAPVGSTQVASGRATASCRPMQLNWGRWGKQSSSVC